LTQDKFRPLHLRYLSHDPALNNFNLLLDKGDQLKDTKESLKPKELSKLTKELLKYFLIGVSLPNDAFWVNLRPDSPENIIDPELAQTDIGKVFLEIDLQLKKDTALATSPDIPQGKEYWDKLYQKAEELFGTQNVSIPTLTRPWIVPDEIIIRETPNNAYIYKATLKVMLEQDYLESTGAQGNKNTSQYVFDDPRLKELNEYSTQLIRQLILPNLAKEVNTSKRYAPLRQVYYSLILAQWFKDRFQGRSGLYPSLIDSKNLNGLVSQEGWDKSTYFKQYQASFQKGEYNYQTTVNTLSGRSIRTYFSGGIAIGKLLAPQPAGPGATTEQGRSMRLEVPPGELQPSSDFIASASVDATGATRDNPLGVEVQAGTTPTATPAQIPTQSKPAPVEQPAKTAEGSLREKLQSALSHQELIARQTERGVVLDIGAMLDQGMFTPIEIDEICRQYTLVIRFAFRGKRDSVSQEVDPWEIEKRRSLFQALPGRRVDILFGFFDPKVGQLTAFLVATSGVNMPEGEKVAFGDTLGKGMSGVARSGEDLMDAYVLRLHKLGINYVSWNTSGGFDQPHQFYNPYLQARGVENLQLDSKGQPSNSMYTVNVSALAAGILAGPSTALPAAPISTSATTLPLAGKKQERLGGGLAGISFLPFTPLASQLGQLILQNTTLAMMAVLFVSGLILFRFMQNHQFALTGAFTTQLQSPPIPARTAEFSLPAQIGARRKVSGGVSTRPKASSWSTAPSRRTRDRQERESRPPDTLQQAASTAASAGDAVKPGTLEITPASLLQTDLSQRQFSAGDLRQRDLWPQSPGLTQRIREEVARAINAGLQGVTMANQGEFLAQARSSGWQQAALRGIINRLLGDWQQDAERQKNAEQFKLIEQEIKTFFNEAIENLEAFLFERKTLRFYQESSRFLASDHPLVRQLQGYLDLMHDPTAPDTRLYIAIDGRRPEVFRVWNAVVINLALIQALDTEDEVIAVLAHEQWHQERRVDASFHIGDSPLTYVNRIFASRLREHEADLYVAPKLARLAQGANRRLNTKAIIEALLKVASRRSLQDTTHGSISGRILAVHGQHAVMDFEVGRERSGEEWNQPIPSNWRPSQIMPSLIERLTATDNSDSDFQEALGGASLDILLEAKKDTEDKLQERLKRARAIEPVLLSRFTGLFNRCAERIRGEMSLEGYLEERTQETTILATLLNSQQLSFWLDLLYGERGQGIQGLKDMLEGMVIRILSSGRTALPYAVNYRLRRFEERGDLDNVADFLSQVVIYNRQLERQVFGRSAEVSDPEYLTLTAGHIWGLRVLRPGLPEKEFFKRQAAVILGYYAHNFWARQGFGPQALAAGMVLLGGQLRQANEYYQNLAGLSNEDIFALYDMPVHIVRKGGISSQGKLSRFVRRSDQIGFEEYHSSVFAQTARNTFQEKLQRALRERNEGLLIEILNEHQAELINILKPSNEEHVLFFGSQGNEAFEWIFSVILNYWHTDAFRYVVDEASGNIRARYRDMQTKYLEDLVTSLGLYSLSRQGQIEKEATTRILRFCSILDIVMHLPATRQVRFERLRRILESEEAKALFAASSPLYLLLVFENLKSAGYSNILGNVSLFEGQDLDELLNTQLYLTVRDNLISCLFQGGGISQAMAIYEYLTKNTNSPLLETRGDGIVGLGISEAHVRWLMPLNQAMLTCLERLSFDAGNALRDQRLSQAPAAPHLDYVNYVIDYYFALDRYLPTSADKRQILWQYACRLIEKLQRRDLARFLSRLASKGKEKWGRPLYDYFVLTRIKTSEDFLYFQDTALEMWQEFSSKGSTELTGLVLLDTLLDRILSEGASERVFRAMLGSSNDDTALRQILAPYWFVSSGDALEKLWGYKIAVNPTTHALEVVGANRGNFVTLEELIGALYRLSPSGKFLIMQKLLLGPNGLLHQEAGREHFAQMITAYLPQQQGVSELLNKIVSASCDTMEPEKLSLALSNPLLTIFLQRPAATSAVNLRQTAEAIKSLIVSHIGEVAFKDQEAMKGLGVEAYEDFLARSSQRPDHSAAYRGLQPQLDSLQAKLKSGLGLAQAQGPAASQRPGQAKALEPIDIIMEACGHLGPVGVRFLQLLGQYLVIPQEYQERFRDAYDAARGQDQLVAFRTLQEAARYYPEVASFVKNELHSIVQRIGGGSIVTVFLVRIYDLKDGKRIALLDAQGKPSGEYQTHLEVLKIENPNPLSNVREVYSEAVKVIEHMISQAQARSAAPQELRSYEIARRLLDDIRDWVIRDIEDYESGQLDAVYQAAHQDFVASNGVRVAFSEMKRPYNRVIKRESFVPGVTLNKILKWRLSAKTLQELRAQEEANQDTQALNFLRQVELKMEQDRLSLDAALAELLKRGTQAIIEDFTRHLVQPIYRDSDGQDIYLTHSDMHFGNVIMSPDFNTVYSIDRNLYIRMDKEDVAFARQIARGPKGYGLGTLREIIGYFTGLSENRAFSGGILGIQDWRTAFGIGRAVSQDQPGFQQMMHVLQELEALGIKIPLKSRIMLKNIMAINAMLRDAGAGSFSAYVEDAQKNPAYRRGPAVKDANIPGAGQQTRAADTSGIGAKGQGRPLERLRRILRVLGRQQDLSEAEAVQQCLDYLERNAPTLVSHEEMPSEDGKGSIELVIIDYAQLTQHSDPLVIRIATAIHDWAQVGNKGVEAINYRDRNERWKIVGFKEQLGSALEGLSSAQQDARQHEAREIRLRSRMIEMYQRDDPELAHELVMQDKDADEEAIARAAQQAKAAYVGQIGADVVSSNDRPVVLDDYPTVTEYPFKQKPSSTPTALPSQLQVPALPKTISAPFAAGQLEAQVLPLQQLREFFGQRVTQVLKVNRDTPQDTLLAQQNWQEALIVFYQLLITQTVAPQELRKFFDSQQSIRERMVDVWQERDFLTAHDASLLRRVNQASADVEFLNATYILEESGILPSQTSWLVEKLSQELTRRNAAEVNIYTDKIINAVSAQWQRGNVDQGLAVLLRLWRLLDASGKDRIKKFFYHLYGVPLKEAEARHGSLEDARQAQVKDSLKFLLTKELGRFDEEMLQAIMDGKVPQGASRATRILINGYLKGLTPARLQALAVKVNVLEEITRGRPEFGFARNIVFDLLCGSRIAAHIRPEEAQFVAGLLLELVARIGFDEFETIDMVFLPDGSALLYSSELLSLVADATGMAPGLVDLEPNLLQASLRNRDSLIYWATQKSCPYAASLEGSTALEILQSQKHLPLVLPPTFSTIVIPTRSQKGAVRTSDLMRTIQSYLQSLDMYHAQEKVSLIVFDDSQDEFAASTQAAVEQFGSRVQYIGKKQKEEFLRGLSTQRGVAIAEELMPHLLFNRNFIGLYLKQPYITVDDDSLAQAFTLTPERVQAAHILGLHRARQAQEFKILLARLRQENAPEEVLAELASVYTSHRIAQGVRYITSDRSRLIPLISTLSRPEGLRPVTADVLSAMNQAALRCQVEPGQALILETGVRGDMDQAASGIIRDYIQTSDPEIVAKGKVKQINKHSLSDFGLHYANVAIFTTATGMLLPYPMPSFFSRYALRNDDLSLSLLSFLAARDFRKEKSGLSLLHQRGSRTQQNLAQLLKRETLVSGIIQFCLQDFARGQWPQAAKGVSGPEAALAGLASLLVRLEATPAEYVPLDTLQHTPGSLSRELLEQVRKLIELAAAYVQDLGTRQASADAQTASQIQGVVSEFKTTFYLDSQRPESLFYQEARSLLIDFLRQQVEFLRLWNRLNGYSRPEPSTASERAPPAVQTAAPATLPAGTDTRPRAYLKDTFSGRNQDVTAVVTSPQFQEITGINLREGRHVVMDIGVGALPLTTVEFAQALGGLNSSIKVIGTELPGALHQAQIISKGLLAAYRQRIVQVLRENYGLNVDPQSLFELRLGVIDNQVSEVMVGMRYRNGGIGYKTIAVAENVVLESVSGERADEKWKRSALLNEMVGFLGREGIKRLLEARQDTATQLNDIELEVQFDPVGKTLRSSGAYFAATPNPLEALQSIQERQASIITANYVTMHMPEAALQEFMQLMQGALREGGVLVLKNLTRDLGPGNNYLEFYQARNGALVLLGSLVTTSKGDIIAKKGVFVEYQQARESYITGLFQQAGLDPSDEQISDEQLASIERMYALAESLGLSQQEFQGQARDLLKALTAAPSSENLASSDRPVGTEEKPPSGLAGLLPVAPLVNQIAQLILQNSLLTITAITLVGGYLLLRFLQDYQFSLAKVRGVTAVGGAQEGASRLAEFSQPERPSEEGIGRPEPTELIAQGQRIIAASPQALSSAENCAVLEKLIRSDIDPVFKQPWVDALVSGASHDNQPAIEAIGRLAGYLENLIRSNIPYQYKLSCIYAFKSAASRGNQPAIEAIGRLAGYLENLIRSDAPPSLRHSCIDLLGSGSQPAAQVLENLIRSDIQLDDSVFCIDALKSAASRGNQPAIEAIGRLAGYLENLIRSDIYPDEYKESCIDALEFAASRGNQPAIEAIGRLAGYLENLIRSNVASQYKISCICALESAASRDSQPAAQSLEKVVAYTWNEFQQTRDPTKRQQALRFFSAVGPTALPLFYSRLKSEGEGISYSVSIGLVKAADAAFGELAGDLKGLCIGSQAYVKLLLLEAALEDYSIPETLKSDLRKQVIPALKQLEGLTKSYPSLGMELGLQLKLDDPQRSLLALTQVLACNYLKDMPLGRNLGKSSIKEKGYELRIVPATYPIFILLIKRLHKMGLIADGDNYMTTVAGNYMKEANFLMPLLFLANQPYLIPKFQEAGTSGTPEGNSIFLTISGHFVGATIDLWTGELLKPADPKSKGTQTNLCHTVRTAFSIDIPGQEEYTRPLQQMFQDDLERTFLLTTAAAAFLGEYGLEEEGGLKELYAKFRSRVMNFLLEEMQLTPDEIRALFPEGHYSNIWQALEGLRLLIHRMVKHFQSKRDEYLVEVRAGRMAGGILIEILDRNPDAYVKFQRMINDFAGEVKEYLFPTSSAGGRMVAAALQEDWDAILRESPPAASGSESAPPQHFQALKLSQPGNLLTQDTIDRLKADPQAMPFQAADNRVSMTPGEATQLADVLQMSEGELGALIQATLDRLGRPASPPRLALLEENQSEHLFENCKEDGFIGINKAFFRIVQTNPQIARALLCAGLFHEMQHELGQAVDETNLNQEAQVFLDNLTPGINPEQISNALAGQFATSAFLRAVEAQNIRPSRVKIRLMQQLNGKLVFHDGVACVFSVVEGSASTQPLLGGIVGPAQYDTAVVLSQQSDYQKIGYMEFDTTGSRSNQMGFIRITNPAYENRKFAQLILSEVRQALPPGMSLFTEIGEQESLRALIGGGSFYHTKIAKVFQGGGWEVADYWYIADSGEYHSSYTALRAMQEDKNRGHLWARFRPIRQRPAKQAPPAEQATPPPTSGVPEVEEARPRETEPQPYQPELPGLFEDATSARQGITAASEQEEGQPQAGVQPTTSERYLAPEHRFAISRGLVELEEVYPDLKTGLQELNSRPEGADVLLVGPGLGFAALDIFRDYPLLRIKTLGLHNLFQRDYGFSAESIQDRYRVSLSDAQAMAAMLRNNFTQGDITGDLSFREGEFDAVIIGTGVMEHIDDMPRVVSQAHRLLKIGGVAFIEIRPMVIGKRPEAVLLDVRNAREVPSAARREAEVVWEFFRQPDIHRGELSIQDLAGVANSLTLRKNTSLPMNLPLVMVTEPGALIKGFVIRPSSIRDQAGSSGQSPGGISGATGSASTPPASGQAGGIDLRALPIVTQPMPSLSPMGRPLASLDSPVYPELEEEWQQLKQMLNSGITPSLARIKEYLEACCQKDNSCRYIDKVLAFIAEILRIEEDQVVSTDTNLKKLLVLLASGSQADEITSRLKEIEIPQAEPAVFEEEEE
jgi:SAM-dependent methyltransferase